MGDTRNKHLYKWIFYLAAPIALQNIITMSVALADNLMVGSLGELALSGVYVANQLQNLLHMLIIGLGTALTVIAVQYWGIKDIKSIKSLIGIALKISLGAGLIFLLSTLLYPRGILRLFSNEKDVLIEAFSYMKIIRYTYMFFALSQVLIASLRCVETVKIGMHLSIVTFFVNIFFNWVLIYGKLGVPALGVEGAALATFIARALELFLIIIYIRFIDTKLKLRFSEVFKSNYDLLKDFFRYGFPIILGDIFWGLNLVVQGAIVGRLGTAALASVSIANTVFAMISVGMYGVSDASSVIIGQTVGAKEYDTAREYAKKLQWVFLIVGLGSGGIMYFIKDYILLLYNISGETINMARQLMTILSITIVGSSYQTSSLLGIVRAGGSVYFVLINDLIFVWLIVIPSALIAAHVFHASPVVVFACLRSDQILKCIVAIVKVNRFKWIKNLTRNTSAVAS